MLNIEKEGEYMNNLFRDEMETLFSAESEYIYDSELAEFANNIIIKNKNNLPILYRYSPADYYNIRGIETRKIYLSEVGKMNDIFEGLTGEVDNEVINNIDKLYDLAYLKSFSENHNNLKMWSTYADNYAGMCVAYDVKKLPDNVLYHLFPVRYSDSRLIKNDLHFSFKDLIYMKKRIEEGDDYDFTFLKDVMGLFISKSTNWMEEQEWRLIVTYLQMFNSYDEVELHDDTQYENKLYEIDYQNVEFDCAIKIYLGPKMEELKKEHLKEIGKNLGIDVVEMCLSNTEYKLLPKGEK